MMGFFSNLFAKQNCAVCGKECGTLHRSKLRDGQFLCDDCGNKCSKYIRLSELTLDEAKEHMEYMARMKRVFDEVFDKTEFRVNAYPSTPTQMGLVFCDELGMLYIDDRTGGRGKMPELIRYDQIASYEEYLDETPAKEPGQEPTLNGGGLKLKLVQPRGITEAETRRGMHPHPYIKQELVICFSKRDRREIGYAHIARQHLDHIFGVHDNETSLFGRRMSKAEERELKGQMGMIGAMGLATAALGLTACGGSGAASASSVSSAPASSSSAPSASAQPESAVDKAAPAGAPVTQFQTGELTIGEYTFKAQYIPFDVRRELDGAHHCIHADSYRGNYFFSFYNEDDEEQSAKIFEYAIKDDRLTPVEEYNIDGSNALSIDRNGILYAMDNFDVYCYDLNSSDPEEPGDALDYMGSCYSSKDRDLTVIYRTDSAPVLVQDGEYTELTLEGDNEIGPFCSMPSLNLSGDELLTVGEPDSSGDYYFAAFDLDGNELARSSQPVGSFDAVMMKRPNGYLLDTGYMWELYAPDGTFLEKSLPVGERETLCQLCGDFCTFDVFLPLEENAFLAVGHHGKATEPDEPVVFRITTDF
mgnify:CR=1 FL=1